MAAPLQDVMNYYLWNFSAYLVALAIIFLNAARSVYFFLRNKRWPIYPKRGRMDLLISLLCGVILGEGLAFQGILADNNAPNIYHWTSYLWMICLAALVLFLVQVIFHFKTPGHPLKEEPTQEIPASQPPYGQPPAAPAELRHSDSAQVDSDEGKPE